MKPPCEMVVSRILPMLRAALVRSIIAEHGLKQREVARLLGITQSSVSQYVTSARAGDRKLLKAFPEIEDFARNTAKEIAGGRAKATHMMFCDACMHMRGTKEFCRHHREWVQLAKCRVCFD